MHWKHACPTLALISFALVGCSTSHTPVPPSAESVTAPFESAARVAVSRIEVTPSAALLTAAGQTTTLKATLYDAQGLVITGTVKWISSNPSVVEITTKGVVKARVAVGSSQITAEVNGVKSKPVLITVAKLNPNAVVVTDAQLASGAIPLTPGPNGSLLGAQFKVTLNGVTPKAGQVLLSSGVSPINGRVLSSVPSGKQTVVTLETVPLGTVYQDLNVSQRAQLTSSDVVPLTGAQAPEKTVRHPDGSLTVSYRLPEGMSRSPSLSLQSLPNDDYLPGPFAKKEFEVGPFKCSTTLDTLVSGDLISLKIENKLDVDLTATMTGGELQTLSAIASGDLSGTVTGGIDVDLGAQGEIKCRAIFAQVPVPVSGPLAMIMAPTIPVGVGFVLDGKLKLGKVQFAMEGKIGSKRKLGFVYDGLTGAVTPINEGETTSTWTPKLKSPNPFEDFRFEGGLAVQAVMGFDITGMPWLGYNAPSFKALELTFGPKIEGNLAPGTTQAQVNDYSSSYALKLVGGLGPGESLQDLASLWGTRNQWKLFNFAPLVEVMLSRSPNGTISGPSQAKTNQPATIRVDLNPANVNFLPGVYNVGKVNVYRDRNGVLELVGTQTAADGATHFEFPWTPAPGDAGQTAVFRAFTEGNLIGLPLELDDDAKLAVAVSLDDSTPPPPPPSEPGDGSGRWVGSTLSQWNGNESSGASGGIVSSTHVANGSSSCTLGDVDANGQQSASWSYQLDERIEKVDTNDYLHVTTKTANISRTSLLQDSAHPDDYILTVIKVYMSNGVLYSLGTKVDPVNARYSCALYPVHDENPDPLVIQGYRITHEPNPNWTQRYQVDVTLK